MNRPNRLPILSSLLMLAVAVAISAAATASFPGAVSAQAYPELRVENVRAHGMANQITITWEPPPPAKDRTVGTGDDATTIERTTGVSKYVLRFENRPARDITVSSQDQGADVSTVVTGLERGKRYHFSIQTCFDGTAGYSGCFLPEGYRAAYTAPKAPLFLSANNVDDDSISLSWEGGNTLDLPRTPSQTSVPGLDFYDWFECEGRITTNATFSDCESGLSERAKTATVTVFDPDVAYELRVRHKARSYTTRVNVRDNENYDVDGSYEAGPWREVTVGRKPPAPTNVRVSRTGNSATVEWDAVPETYNGAFVGNVSYLVAHYIPADCSTTTSQCPDNAKPQWATSTTGTTATVSGLLSNKTYAFSVLSRTEHRIGESSGWVGELETAPNQRETIAERYDTNDNGIVDQAELAAAINDFYDYYDRITYDELQELLDIYNSQQSE